MALYRLVNSSISEEFSSSIFIKWSWNICPSDVATWDTVTWFTCLDLQCNYSEVNKIRMIYSVLIFSDLAVHTPQMFMCHTRLRRQLFLCAHVCETVYNISACRKKSWSVINMAIKILTCEIWCSHTGFNLEPHLLDHLGLHRSLWFKSKLLWMLETIATASYQRNRIFAVHDRKMFSHEGAF
jgi:hypothetical protein